MPIVNVPGVGQVRFPDDMSEKDIISAIENDILKAPKKEAKVADYLKDIPKAIGRGAVSLLETAGMGAAAALPEEYETQARAGIAGLAAPAKEYLAPVTSEIGESIPSTLAAGVGSTLPFFALGPAGLLGRAGAAGLGVAAGAGEARMGAEAAGATPEERAKATALGAPTGLLDIIAPNIGPLKSVITTALARGGVEGATEAAQKIAQNLIAKGIYNPKQDVLVGSAEEGVYGAGVGALTSLLVDLTLGRRARVPAKPAVTPEAPPTEAPPTEAPPALTGGFTAEEATRLREEATTAEQQRLDELEQRRAEQEQMQAQATEMMRERAAGLPGMTGLPGANVEMMRAARAREEEQAAAEEKQRKAEAQQAQAETQRVAEERQARVDEINATTFSPDPVQNELIKRREMATLPPLPPVEAPTFEPITAPQEKPRGVETFKYSPAEKAEIEARKADLADVNKQIKEAATVKTSLFKALEGKLITRPGAMSLADIDKDNKTLKRLYNKQGRGALLEDVVSDGLVDDFLPPNNRAVINGEQNPNFDSTAAVETIAEKLRSGDYGSYDETQNLRSLNAQKDALKTELERLEKLPEVRGELAAATPKRGVEPLALSDLESEAKLAGVDTEALKERLAIQNPEATPAQFQGLYREALTGATGYEVGGFNYTAEEIEEAISERLTDEELDRLIQEAEAEQRATAPAPKKPAARKEAAPAPERAETEVEPEVITIPGAGKSRALGDAVANNNFAEIAGILQKSKNPVIANIGRLATSLTRTFTEINPAVVKKSHPRALAGWSEVTNGIYYRSKKAAESEHVNAHEIAHALTYFAIHNPTAAQKPAVNRLKNLYRFIKSLTDSQGIKVYGLTNLDEFVAEANSNPSFQQFLAQTPYQKQTAWGAFTQAIADLLGIKNSSALTEVLALTEELTSTKSRTGKGKSVVPLEETTAGWTENRIDQLIRTYGYNDGRTYGIAAEVNPREFVLATTPTKEAADLLSEEAGELDADKIKKETQTPFLDVDIEKNVIVGHEGRHRMAALARAGVERVPVVLYIKDRYGSKKPDAYEPQRGFKLKGQSFQGGLGAPIFAYNLIPISYNYKDQLTDAYGKGNILFLKEAQKEQTPTARDSLEVLSGIGRTVAEPEPGYVEKVRQSWNNAVDNPEITKEKAIGGTRKFLDKVQTMAFSSDAALNNQIKREILKSNLGQEQKVGILLNASLSQTVHSDAVANLFLMKGNIKWDESVHKWVGVDDSNNIVNLSGELDKIAEKHGLTKEEIELIAHTAFEAKRTQSLIRKNAEIDAKAAAMKAEAGMIRGRSPVAASELTDKANKLLAKKVVIQYEGEQLDAFLKAGMTQFEMFPELRDVVKIWDGIRTNAVNTMVESGLYSQEEAETLLANADYVPFYREDQIEEGKGPKEFLRSLSVQADKRIKGSQKPVNDIFDNMVRWTQYAINRSVRNRSALALIDTAQAVGLAEKVADPKGADNVVRVWRDGKEEFHSMADPMFVDAFRGLESVAIPTIKFFSKFADRLRQSVVLFPAFAVSQVTQDSFAAMFTSGLKPQYALRIPVLAVKEFVQTLRGKSATHEELKNIGAVGVRDFSSSVIRADLEVLAGLKKDKSLWDSVKRKLNHFSMASDNAVRQATFEAAMAQGMSRKEAYEKVFEIFNVRRRGSSQMLAMAGQVIPFFNAYLAAQNVAYRTLTGAGTSPTDRKAALQTLGATTASVMALSFIYAMMMGDDEDYEKKPTPTRDRLLMIPGSGGLGVPLRADAFILPKVLAEHTYALITDNGMTDPAKFRSSLASLLASSVLSPTPVPQAIKPVAESILNYNFFQQQPLVGIYQAKKDVSRQFEDSTSELAKVLGKAEVMSPIVIDHLVRGMFGSFGGALLLITNPMIAAMAGTTRPDMSLQDAINAIPSASAFVSKEYEIGLRKDFYALKEVTDRAASTLSDLKNRSPQEIEEYLSDPKVRQRIGMAPMVSRISSQLTDIRKKVNLITNIEDPQFTDERKERLIKQLREQEYQLLKNIDLRKLREMAQM